MEFDSRWNYPLKEIWWKIPDIRLAIKFYIMTKYIINAINSKLNLKYV
jgi:hypothetical protein